MKGNQNSEFYKFPRTPHLFAHSNIDIRLDKVMTENECLAFLSQELIIEEKADGANLGISFNQLGELKFQNRGNYLEHNSHPQFAPLWDWAYSRLNLLTQYISGDYIVFGEWCYIRHSIFYSKLPDWFLGFDIYDKKRNQFLGADFRNELLTKINVRTVPKITEGRFSKKEIIQLLENNKSQLGGGALEGLYFRTEENGYVSQRAKVVNQNFTQQIEEHWTKQKLVKNIRVQSFD